MTDESNITDAERAFAGAAGRRLRARAEAVDPPSAARLAAARRRALAEYSPARRTLRILGPALAAGLVVAVGLALGPRPGGGPPAVPVLTAEEAPDLPLILAEGDPEMMADLDLYTWMDPTLEPAELEAALDSTS